MKHSPQFAVSHRRCSDPECRRQLIIHRATGQEFCPDCLLKSMLEAVR